MACALAGSIHSTEVYMALVTCSQALQARLGFLSTTAVVVSLVLLSMHQLILYLMAADLLRPTDVRSTTTLLRSCIGMYWLQAIMYQGNLFFC